MASPLLLESIRESYLYREFHLIASNSLENISLFSLMEPLWQLYQPTPLASFYSLGAVTVAPRKVVLAEQVSQRVLSRLAGRGPP